MAAQFLKGVDLNNNRAVNVADPSSATDAATKQYVDNRVDGLSYKDEVRVSTTTTGTLATAYAAGQTIDGVVLATNDRLLLKDQSTQTENGIYKVNASGAPTRTTDADTTAELNNATVYVTSGTVNGGREYTQTTQNPTVGTNNIVFAQKQTGITYTADGQGIVLSSNQFSLALDGTTLSKSVSGLRIGPGANGNGLTNTAGVLAVGAGTGISVGTSTVSIDTSVVARKYAADCAATTNPQTFTHGLATKDVDVTVVVNSTGTTVFADVTAPTTGTVVVDFGGAPTAAQYRVVVMG